ncbi:MAG: hypothetical protein GF308_00095 [Candidatus Heimdallarchaeota archaeon]|nr:hypothetical protein [Candidatus Heimdallarchaeota archaeon]
MIIINILWISLACLFSYLFGSIPFSVWLGKLVKDTDLRTQKVKNPGGFNALRTFGPKIGLPIMFLDFFKGTIPFAFIDQLFSLDYFVTPDGTNIWHGIACILGPMFCILGHNYPVWLKFKGGQGVGVFIGVLIYLNPLIFVLFLLLFIIIMPLFKISAQHLTMIVGAVCLVAILFIPISPPWSLVNQGVLVKLNGIIQLQPAFVLIGMEIMIYLRYFQKIIARSRAVGKWTFSIKEGEEHLEGKK